MLLSQSLSLRRLLCIYLNNTFIDVDRSDLSLDLGLDRPIAGDHVCLIGIRILQSLILKCTQ